MFQQNQGADAPQTGVKKMMKETTKEMVIETCRKQAINNHYRTVADKTFEKLIVETDSSKSKTACFEIIKKAAKDPDNLTLQAQVLAATAVFFASFWMGGSVLRAYLLEACSS